MKKKWVYIIFFYLIFMGMGLDNKTKNVNIILKKEGKISESLIQTQKYEFYLPYQWEVKKSVFKLYYSKPETKGVKGQGITVFFNNVPLKNIEVSENKLFKEKLEIEVPQSLFVKGENKLTLKRYIGIKSGQWEKLKDRKYWIFYDGLTNLKIEYSFNGEEKLKDFPDSYIQRGIKTIISYSLKNEENLGELMLLGTVFGRLSQEETMEIYDTDILEENLYDNLIFLGKYADLSDKYKEYFSAEEVKKLKNKALIREIEKEGRKVLLIVSDNKNALRNAILFLGDADLEKAEKGSIWIEKIKLKNHEKEVGNYLHFKELVKTPLVIEGGGYQEGKIEFFVPLTWEILDNSKLKLNFKFSEFLNINDSYIKVFLNEIPIYTDKIKNLKTEGLEIEVPRNFFSRGLQNLKIQTYMEPKEAKSNYFLEERGLWTYVNNNSYLYLPHSTIRDARLENLKGSFIKEGYLEDIIFIIPNKDNIRLLKSIFDFSMYLGKNIKGSSKIDVILEIPEVIPQETNVVYFDILNSGNSALEFIEENTEIKYNKKTKILSLPKSMEGREISSKDTTIIHIKKNILGKTMFFLIGADESEINRSLELIKEEKSTGNTAIIVRDSYLLITDNKESKFKTPSTGNGKNKINHIKFFALIIVFILMAFLIRRRKRD